MQTSLNQELLALIGRPEVERIARAASGGQMPSGGSSDKTDIKNAPQCQQTVAIKHACQVLGLSTCTSLCNAIYVHALKEDLKVCALEHRNP